jgi:molecular chaperone HtpG
LINDYEKYLAVKHFRTEGGVGFKVLLFTSKRAIYDLFEPKKKFNKSNFVSDVFLS